MQIKNGLNYRRCCATHKYHLQGSSWLKKVGLTDRLTASAATCQPRKHPRRPQASAVYQFEICCSVYTYVQTNRQSYRIERWGQKLGTCVSCYAEALLTKTCCPEMLFGPFPEPLQLNAVNVSQSYSASSSTFCHRLLSMTVWPDYIL
jgi:hypothetical protein